jgi:hypothetical protein
VYLALHFATQGDKEVVEVVEVEVEEVIGELEFLPVLLVIATWQMIQECSA